MHSDCTRKMHTMLFKEQQKYRSFARSANYEIFRFEGLKRKNIAMDGDEATFSRNICKLITSNIRLNWKENIE